MTAVTAQAEAASGATRALLFLSFAAIASGTLSPAVVLTFWFAILLVWTWHSMLMWSLLQESRRAP